MAEAFPLSLDDAVAFARELVRERYPHARAAWLGGSVAAGEATSTSDLDVTVLLDGEPAPMRTSTTVDGIPVELFVHTAESLQHYRAEDRDRRRPTTARLVAGSIRLLGAEQAAADEEARSRAELAAGPPAVELAEIDVQRYAVTGLRDDLRGCSEPTERMVIAAELFAWAARLLLLRDRCWHGSGKGLLRELRDRDETAQDDLGERLVQGLSAAAHEPRALLDAVESVLEHCGGPLFDGFALAGEPGQG